MGDLRPGEVQTDAGLVRRLLAGQFPQWTGLPIVPADSFGTDNAMYRLGADKAVRLPRFPRWAPQVDREQRWLPQLAPRLPLAVPVPLAMGLPAEGYPFRWSVYPWLAGENPAIERITDPARAASELAGFITALQRIDPPAARRPRPGAAAGASPPCSPPPPTSHPPTPPAPPPPTASSTTSSPTTDSPTTKQPDRHPSGQPLYRSLLGTPQASSRSVRSPSR